MHDNYFLIKMPILLRYNAIQLKMIKSLWKHY